MWDIQTKKKGGGGGGGGGGQDLSDQLPDIDDALKSADDALAAAEGAEVDEVDIGVMGAKRKGWDSCTC